MSKPLTIEELKALPVGEWVWVVDKLKGIQEYAIVEKSTAIGDKGFITTISKGSYGFGYYDSYGIYWLAYKNKEEAEGKDEQIKFTLNGCDIFFTATAPADMTVKQLVKQASRIKPDWCACGVCSAEDNDEVEIVFDYNDVKKANDDVSCTIKEEYIK